MMNEQSLAGLRVMVTRPEPAGSELCAYLQTEGAETVYFPTIAFAPPPNPDLLARQITLLGDQRWIIFISPQAVHASVALIRRAWPHLPPQTQIAAVGAGTANALKAAGYVAIHPVDHWSSEGLLALPAFQRLENTTCAIVRGEGGRDLLEQTLVARGATVLSLIAYQRVLPDIDTQPFASLLEQQKIDAIICTSYESVRNLKELMGDQHWPALKKRLLIVVSERIKLLAQDLGFQTICVASNASHAAMVAALKLALSL